MGSFQKMTSCSVQCAHSTIMTNCIVEVEAELIEDGEIKKCRRDLKNMEFDPKLNLKDPRKYKKMVAATASRNNDDEVNLECKIE